MDNTILLIECPKQLKNSYKAYSFLLKVQKRMQSFTNETIIWQMINTRNFDVNLLSMMYFMFVEQWEKKKEIYVVLPDKKICCGRKVLLQIFNFYAEDKRSFFKPRLITDEKTRENEDILLKYLKKLELARYDLIKTLLSEMIANIKMHTESKVGYITSHYSKEENMILVSIANSDFSIMKQLELKRGMIFEDDVSALLWTLKKSNSTRIEEESGGLGLYLLRKYIHQLGGQAVILSGRCYLEFDSGCFNPKAENIIHIKEVHQVTQEFIGTVITLKIPYILEKEKVDEEPMSLMSIWDIIGG